MKAGTLLLVAGVSWTGFFSPADSQEIPANAIKIGPITTKGGDFIGYNYLKPGPYVSDGSDLIAEEAYKEGHLISRSFFHGWNLNGTQREWFVSGQLKSEKHYKDGVMDGAFKQWNAKGELVADYTMTNGTGIETVYDDNGRLIEEGHYKNNQRDGRLIEINADVVSIADFKMGELSGISVAFYKDGSVQELCWGPAGPMVVYDRDGSVIEKSWHLQVGFAPVSEDVYAQHAAKDPTIAPYYSDVRLYKILVPEEMHKQFRAVLAMPSVKIPLK